MGSVKQHRATRDRQAAAAASTRFVEACNAFDREAADAKKY
jgi:hypothetical protein